MIKDTIYNLLTADAALMASLPGGIHLSTEISRQEAAAAFDSNRELLACALIKQETTSPVVRELRAERTYVAIYFYQRGGTDQIDAACDRAYTLLDDARLDLGDRPSWLIEHSDDLSGRQDPALLCPMTVSRYRVTSARA